MSRKSVSHASFYSWLSLPFKVPYHLRMESRRFPQLALCAGLVLTATAALTGCGLLGGKNDPSGRVKDPTNSAGCLNALGPQFDEYLQGTIDPARWRATWECVTGSLTLFKTFVKPSQFPGAFSLPEMASMAKQFMVTSRPISESLMRASFALKASLLGGPSDRVTQAELDGLIALVDLLKAESIRLLPTIADYRRRPSPAHVEALGLGVQKLLETLSARLPLGPNTELEGSALTVLLDEVKAMHGFPYPTGIGTWILALKRVVLGGPTHAVGPQEWASLLRLGGWGLSLWLAASQTHSELAEEPGESAQQLGRAVRPLLNQLQTTASSQGGAIPAQDLATAVSFLPPEWLDAAPKQAILETMPSLLEHALGGGRTPGLTLAALQNVQGAWNLWERSQFHLETLYSEYRLDKLGASGQDLREAIERYLGRLSESDRAIVRGLKIVVERYTPLFAGDDREITFADLGRYSLRGLSLMQLIRTVASRLVAGYSTQAARDRVSQKDFDAFMLDLMRLGGAFKKLDESVAGFPTRRFYEINLFTPVSDGNPYLDVDEVTYFVAYIVSLWNLSDRVMARIEPLCGGSEQDVAYGRPWMEVECFRKRFAENIHSYWDHLPELLSYYDRLSSAEQHRLLQAMEQGARRYGLSQAPVGRFDVEALTGIAHFIESLFRRLDVDGVPDQVLNTREALSAFPIFRDAMLQFSGGITNQGLLEAGFTFTLQHGRAPRRTFPEVLEYANWYIGRPFWKVRAERLQLFQMVGLFATMETR